MLSIYRAISGKQDRAPLSEMTKTIKMKQKNFFLLMLEATDMPLEGFIFSNYVGGTCASGSYNVVEIINFQYLWRGPLSSGYHLSAVFSSWL